MRYEGQARADPDAADQVRGDVRRGRRQTRGEERQVHLDACGHVGRDQIQASAAARPRVKDEGNGKPFEGDIAALGALRTALAVGGADAVERYNAALPAYYAEYEGHVSAMDAWLERIRLSATIAFELHNDGGATATDVDVTLRFPEGIAVCRSREFPEEPKPPRPPRKPGETSFGDSLGRDIAFTPPFELQVHDGVIYVNERNRTVSFSAK